MPQEALKHCDAVVIGEVELVIDKLLDDLEQGSMRGIYKSDARIRWSECRCRVTNS